MASASGVRAGRAFVELSADPSKMNKALQAAQQRLRAFGIGAAKVGAGVAAAGAAIIGPLLAASAKFAGIGDDLDKMAARTGVSVEALSGLGYAAEASGASLETVEAGVAKMQKTLLKASQGGAKATETLESLGLSIADLEKLSPEEQFETLAQALSEVEDPSRRAALSMEVFGGAGQKLGPMMAGGAEGIRALRDESAALGLQLTTKDAASAAALTDAWARVQKTMQAVVMQIGAAVAPALTVVYNAIAQVISGAVDFIRNNRGLVVALGAVGVGLSAVGVAILGVAGAAMGASVAIGALSTVMGVIASPVGLVVAGLGALGAGLIGAGAAALYFSGVGGQAVDWVMTKFGELKEFIGPIINAVSDALSSGDMALAAKIGFTGLKLVFWTALQKFPEMVSDTVQAMTNVLFRFFDWVGEKFKGLAIGMSNMVKAAQSGEMGNVAIEGVLMASRIGGKFMGGQDGGKMFEGQRSEAEAELKSLMDQAASGRVDEKKLGKAIAEAEQEAAAPFTLPPHIVSQVDQGLALAAASASPGPGGPSGSETGAFSAAALMGIFSPQGSSVEEDQLAEQKTTNERLQEIDERLSLMEMPRYA